MIRIEVKFDNQSDKELIKMLTDEQGEPSDYDSLTTSFMFDIDSDIKMQRGEYISFYRFTAIIDSVILSIEESINECSLFYNCHAVSVIV